MYKVNNRGKLCLMNSYQMNFSCNDYFFYFTFLKVRILINCNKLLSFVKKYEHTLNKLQILGTYIYVMFFKEINLSIRNISRP